MRTIDRFGRIDALINTAGSYRGGIPVHEIPVETWNTIFNLNTLSGWHTCQAVIPHMMEQRYGRIENVAVRASLKGGANMGVCSVLKSVVIRLTESMTDELKSNGINVNCVLLGTIDTPHNRKAMPIADHNRWVKPIDIANVIPFLA